MRKFIVPILVIYAGFFGFCLHSAKTQVVENKGFIQISPREVIDISEIVYILLPLYTPPISGCPDCQTRWGAQILLRSGRSLEYLPEADREVETLAQRLVRK